MSPLDNLGISPLPIGIWFIIWIIPSALAFGLVCRKEDYGAIRLAWLILFIIFPIITPLVAVLHYLVFKPSEKKKLKMSA